MRQRAPGSHLVPHPGNSWYCENFRPTGTVGPGAPHIRPGCVINFKVHGSMRGYFFSAISAIQYRSVVLFVVEVGALHLDVLEI